MSDYFSDREFGPVSRIHQVISPVVWAGLVAIVEGMVQSGAFGAKYPQCCSDGQAICGHDASSLERAINAFMPGLDWPLKVEQTGDNFPFTRTPFAPPTPLVLDFVEFVHDSIGRPVLGWHHDYARHYHMTFNQSAGQADFLDQIDALFAPTAVA